MRASALHTYRRQKLSGALVAVLVALVANACLFSLMGLLQGRPLKPQAEPLYRVIDVKLVKHLLKPPLPEPNPRLEQARKPEPTRPLRVRRVELAWQRKPAKIFPRPVPMQRLLLSADLRPLGHLAVKDLTAALAPADEATAGPAIEGDADGLPGRAGYPYERVDEKPQRIRYVEPVFPLVARRLGLSGTVLVEFVVNQSGGVEGARVRESAAGGVFDRAALAAVRRWVFRPGRKDGRPVRVHYLVRITFRLED